MQSAVRTVCSTEPCRHHRRASDLRIAPETRESVSKSMLSDRTLESRFGMRPAAVALWGDVIRWTIAMLAALLVAGLTTVYVQTTRNTIAIRHLQDFGVFYSSAARARSGGALYSENRRASDDARSPANLNPPHFHALMWPLTYLPPAAAFWTWTAISATSLLISVVVISSS